MRKVVGMHFVCRDDLNVTDHGNGTFDTGFWAVSHKHCPGLEYVALHASKDSPSYRQGRVVAWRAVPYAGKERVIFTVESDNQRRDWVGGGSGERGYAYR